ncbi:MAG: helix-turn-helix transcriptional regulator [Burkholderiales bacterium]|nr:helix-turn-helix transcriptional regulator [Burkholderiales bacterium]
MELSPTELADLHAFEARHQPRRRRTDQHPTPFNAQAWRPVPSAALHSPTTQSASALLACMLDEIDYGMLLVTLDGQLRYANRSALKELRGGAPLGLAQGRLTLCDAGDDAVLRSALEDARRTRRRIIVLGRNGSAVSLAVLPLTGGDSEGPTMALLTFGKRRSCESLTIALFAQALKVTAAEAKVLQALCGGAKPEAVAAELGVAVSTVRTHIASLRNKTQTANIRELVAQVAALPPVTSALKMAMAH